MFRKKKLIYIIRRNLSQNNNNNNIRFDIEVKIFYSFEYNRKFKISRV